VVTYLSRTVCNRIIRAQSPSSMGESFFFPCTRRVSMYLRPGTVILSFCPACRVLFLLVSLATVQQLGPTHAQQQVVPRRRAIYRADLGYSTAVGTRTHSSRLSPDDVRFTEQMGHARTVSVCPDMGVLAKPRAHPYMYGARKSPSIPLQVRCFHSLLYTLNSCT
jgi:hypothetical protein